MLIAVRNRTVAHQYRLAVRAAGGNPDNLVFEYLADRGDE